MDRRRFLLASLAATVCTPLAGAAQPAKIARLGVLVFGTPETDAFPAIRRGLNALGYVEGRNIVFEHRFADGRAERLADLALDLVRSKPDVIIATGGDVAAFAKRATATIPIVMISSADPVEGGLIASLAQPGGNVTGVTLVSSDLAGKRLQFLKEAAPAVTRIAVLWNPDHPDNEFLATQAAGRALGVHVQSLEVRSRDDFTDALARAIRERMQAVVVVSSRLMSVNRVRILELAAQNRLLLVSGWGPWAAEGGLLSYGPDLEVVIRNSAVYVDRILKGARAANIPVEQPTKFELVINLKVARAAGLTLPPSLLARADQVIE
jgi:putative tryptophan/tyrosine transport system substrate-binding protein